MDIESEKLKLIEWLSQVDRLEIIERIQAIRLEEEGDFSYRHQEILDERKQRHLNEEGASYSWEELKSIAKNKLKGD